MRAPKNIIESAGGIVLDARGYLALVWSARGKFWGFPKGKIKPDESPEEAAQREIREETNVHEVRLIGPLGDFQRPPRDNFPAIVHLTMFLFQTPETTNSDTAPIQDEKISAVTWLPKAQALEKLTLPEDKKFFRSVMVRLP